MTYKDLVEIDEGVEMIDLGVASVETEGSFSDSTNEDVTSYYTPLAR